MTKYTNELSKTEELEVRMEIPQDYHLKERLSGLKYYGELYDLTSERYYSKRIGKHYRPKHTFRHLNEGHFQGYRFAVHNFTEPGDWVYDPTVGSGTAIIEAVNNNRNGIGIELEWPDMCQKNVDFQKAPGTGIVIPGNAKDQVKLLKPHPKEFQLIINGTPYPVISGGVSSDASQMRQGDTEKHNYKEDKSFGLLKWGMGYENLIRNMYNEAISYLKNGGYLILLIKDPTHQKDYFPLQETIIEWILQDNLDMVEDGYFIHKHIPATLFMSTYQQRFPEVNFPLYQTGWVLQKVKVC